MGGYIEEALHSAEASERLKAAAGHTFGTLREANIARQAEWDTTPNGLDIAYRGNELAGEVGEACNVIKKLERERRGIRGSRATRAQLAEELADVVICTDLIAMAEEIDLDAAVAAKFNATSEKVGLRTRLAASAAVAPAKQAASSFPDRLDTDLRAILGLICFQANPLAICLRAGGAEIPYRAEDEQAHVIHWLLKLWLKHGAGWREAAKAELEAIRQKRAEDANAVRTGAA